MIVIYACSMDKGKAYNFRIALELIYPYMSSQHFLCSTNKLCACSYVINFVINYKK